MVFSRPLVWDGRPGGQRLALLLWFISVPVYTHAITQKYFVNRSTQSAQGRRERPPRARLCLQNNGQENGRMATSSELQCLHGSAGSTGSTSAPTCSAVQINRKAADAWTHATLVYFTEGRWCGSSQRNKLFIHKNGHVIQRRGAIGTLRSRNTAPKASAAAGGSAQFVPIKFGFGLTGSVYLVNVRQWRENCLRFPDATDLLRRG